MRRKEGKEIMSNISTFDGHIRVLQNTSKINEEELNKIINYTERWEYSRLTDAYDTGDYASKKFGEYYKLLSFGRWTWISSMDSLFANLCYEVRADKSMTKEEQEDLIKRMTGLIVEYDGVDTEFGNGVFYEIDGIVEFVNEPGNIEYHDFNDYDLELTAENLEKYNVFEYAGDSSTEFGLNRIYDGLIREGYLTSRVTQEEFNYFMDKSGVDIAPYELYSIVEDFLDTLDWAGIEFPEMDVVPEDGEPVLDNVIFKFIAEHPEVEEEVDFEYIEKVNEVLAELEDNKDGFGEWSDIFAVGEMMLKEVLESKDGNVRPAYIRYLKNECSPNEKVKGILEKLEEVLK